MKSLIGMLVLALVAGQASSAAIAGDRCAW
jgi:hypothetical protein